MSKELKDCEREVQAFHHVLGKDLLIRCGDEKEVDPSDLAKQGWRFFATSTYGTLIFIREESQITMFCDEMIAAVRKCRDSLTDASGRRDAEFVDSVIDLIEEYTGVSLFG